MDEAALEAAIADFNGQLQQLETALSSEPDPTKQADLLKLKEDLCELIELTNASLLLCKKSRLLADLEDSNNLQEHSNGLQAHSSSETPPDSSDTNGNLDSEFAAFYADLGESSVGASDTREREKAADGGEEDSEEEEEEEGEKEGEDYLSGTKVQAPYRTSWGTLEYHNAMVVGAEPADGEEAQVRVLYVYPTQRSMKPCPFYLEDKCRFEDSCRFSHGEVVYLSELREFREFDISNLEEGSSCLARHEDGIWYPAKIKEIDSGFYTVTFDSLLLKEAVVEADGVIPPLREDDLLSSDSDDTGDDEAYAKVMDSAVEPEMLNSSEFGGWEAYTRGIGSKLMLKMGYEFGKGLGKMQEGRVEPVMAVVLPKGNSLDQCLELTQRHNQSKAAKDGSLKGRPKKRRKPRVATRGRQTVFDFLNKKLSNDHTEGGAAAAAAALPMATGVEAYRGGESTKRSLNVKLYQASQRVTQTEREIQRLTESLKRHTSGATPIVKQLEEKLSAARRLLAQQKAQELSIQSQHKKADTHKKMTEF